MTVFENTVPAEQKNTDVLNMHDTLEKAASLNIPLSEYTLRRAIRTGLIPCRIIGRTYFIAWSNVMRWLTCEDGADNVIPASPQSPIRKIKK